MYSNLLPGLGSRRHLSDCGRENCRTLYPSCPEHWCRACLLTIVQRVSQHFDRWTWLDVTQSHF